MTVKAGREQAARDELEAFMERWTVQVRPHAGISGLFDVARRNTFHGGVWETVACEGGLSNAIKTAKALR